MKINYSELLNEMVQKCGLSLREISNKCNLYNAKVSPSYISKLKNGEQDPATEEINRALGRVCKGDVEQLVFEAYMVKMPDILRNFIYKFVKESKRDLKLLLSKSITIDEKQLNEIDIKLSELTPYYIIKEYSLDNLKSLNFKSLEETIDLDKIIPETRVYRMKDDSMKPLLNKNDHIKVYTAMPVFSGDIIAYEDSDKNLYIRRYFEKENSIICIPDNKGYKIKEYKKRKIKIIGKIKQIIKEI